MTDQEIKAKALEIAAQMVIAFPELVTQYGKSNPEVAAVELATWFEPYILG